MEIGSKPIMDAMITCCIDGYNDTSTSYRFYFLTQMNTIIRKYVKFDEHVRCSSS
jgi:hypothetical protein